MGEISRPLLVAPGLPQKLFLSRLSSEVLLGSTSALLTMAVGQREHRADSQLRRRSTHWLRCCRVGYC